MLSEELVKRGNHVSVITAVPHYPSGSVKKEFRYKFPRKVIEGGVEVIRVPLPSVNRSSLFLRLIQLLVFQIWGAFVGLRKQYDVMFLNNPFFMTGIPLFFLGVLKQKPFVYAVYDVYPEIGIQTGIFTNKWIIQLVTALERYCLQKATLVRVLSKTFIPPILGMGIPEEKIRLIYDWVDTDLVRPISKVNDFSIENGLSDKFVVLYAGNIGLSQGLELVLDAASQSITQPDCIFVFVGDGAGKNALVEEAKKRELSNIMFIPFQPREQLPKVLATADISLIILKKGAAFGSLPSKTYSIMASGRPIIACLDPDSEASELIERSGAGFSIPPEDPIALANSIKILKNDKELRAQYGRNGRQYVETHHSPEKAAEQFEQLFNECVNISG